MRTIDHDHTISSDMTSVTERPTHKSDRILYLRPSAGAIPLNERTARLLQREFPNYQLHTADIRDLVKGAKFTIFINMLVTAWVYRRDLVRKKKKFRQCFWRTRFMFTRIRRMVQKAFANESWAFTFQIQSLFDGSIDGVPHFVYTDHTHLANLTYPGFNRSDLFARSWIRCEREIYHRASAVFTMSSNMQSSVIVDYDVDPARVCCVYSGPNIQIDDESKPMKEEGPIEILFVGVDWYRKGGDLLLAAYTQIRPDFPQSELVFVGCNAPVTGLNSDGVRFEGKVPLDRVGHYFEKASIFCMPTRLEPFGIVFIEAMAYELPIVATNVGAVPDLVDDGVNGLLVESEDVDGLANALRRLLDDHHERNKMGRNGRQRYDDRFNWTAVYSQMRQQIATYVHLSPEAR